MKLTLQFCALLLLIAFGDVRGQETDSTTTTRSNEIIDPAQNRLFMMSTGRTMPEKRVSLADFFIFLLQGGYAPTDFLHFNLSYFIPLGEPVYWSVGTKIQIVKPSGGFQGFAVGADIGFFGKLFEISSSYNSQVLSLNAAVSGGDENAKVHFNLAHIIPLNSQYTTNGFPTYMQIGTDIKLHRNSSGGGVNFSPKRFCHSAIEALVERSFSLGYECLVVKSLEILAGHWHWAPAEQDFPQFLFSALV